MSNSSRSLLKNLDYKVPSYANTILYMFGGISMMAFIILIFSGIYLSQFYNPSPNHAHTSIVHAVTQVPLADFMRGLHFWAANLVVVLLLIHVIRVFITGSYKNPRRLTWLTGVALLAITLIYIFLGTVLKWDQEGVEALGHMIESFEIFGIHLGLTNAGIPIITQIYAWHITILLVILLGLLGLHMLLIKIRGISAKPTKNAVSSVTAHQGSSSFLVHLRRLCGFGLIFLAVAGLLAIILPAPIGHQGILEQEVTKPLWMYWPFFGLEDIFGLKGLVWGMLAFFAILAIVPFIDRSPYLYWKKRKMILALGFLFMAAVIGLGVYARLHTAEEHLGMEDQDTAMTEQASADDLDISHHRLQTEAAYLVPILLSVGAIGVWQALPEKK